MKNKLLAISNSLEGIKNLISEFFYGSTVTLTEINKNEWSVQTAKKISDWTRVILVKGRYRFEEIKAPLTKKNSFFKSNTQSSWDKIKAPYAPKEDGDSYVMDAKSTGIYTPILEGSHFMNPKGYMASTYLKWSKQKEDEGDKFKNSGEFIDALKSYTEAFIIADLASHVSYSHNIRHDKVKLTSQKVEKLLKYNDPAIDSARKRILIKKSEIEKILADQGKQDQIAAIEKEYYSFPSNVKINPNIPKKENIKCQ